MNMSWDPRPPLKRAYARVSAGLVSILKAIWTGIVWCGAAVWNGVKALISAIWSVLTAGGRAIGNGFIALIRFVGNVFLRSAALLLRHLKFVIVVGLAAAVVAVAAHFIFFVPHHMVHPMYRPPAASAWDRWFARDLKDTANGDYYYLVNIFFIPFQTALVVIGGLVAWRTLGQGDGAIALHSARSSRC
jgi:hypothetical protein